MPIYEYVCGECKARFERYVRSWNEAVYCPQCEAGEVSKQVSTFAFAGAASRRAGSGGGCGCGRGGCGCHH